MNTLKALIIALPLTLASPATWADDWSNVAIDGQRLTTSQLHALEHEIGSRVMPGSYVVNAAGCWLNLSTGASGCLGERSTFSRYGSGERTGDGSWNHWSNAAGAGVGGTADGCIYTTTGWSNC